MFAPILLMVFIIGIILVIAGFIILYYAMDIDKFVFIYFSFVILAAGAFCIVQAFQIITT